MIDSYSNLMREREREVYVHHFGETVRRSIETSSEIQGKCQAPGTFVSCGLRYRQHGHRDNFPKSMQYLKCMSSHSSCVRKRWHTFFALRGAGALGDVESSVSPCYDGSSGLVAIGVNLNLKMSRLNFLKSQRQY